MKTNAVPFFGIRTDTVYNKSTHQTTVTETRPQVGISDLSVIVDSNLRNDPVVNSHEFRKHYRVGYLGSYFREDSVDSRLVVGKQFDFADFPVFPNVAVLRNAAIGDLYDQLRQGNAGSGLDLAVDIAEAHQVKKMFGDVVVLLGKVRTFHMSVLRVAHIVGPLTGKTRSEFRRKGRQLTADDFSIGPLTGLLVPRKGVKVPDEWLRFSPGKLAAGEIRKRVSTGWIARQWLAYTYGVKPLVNSVFGTFDAVMHRRLFKLAVIKGKTRDRSWSQTTRDDGLFVGSRESLTSQWRSRYMVVGEFQILNSAKQQLLGYTSLNPVNVAWELLPYSFVVDWVLDVGGYLRSLEGALAFGQGFVRGYEVGGYRTSIGGTAWSYKPVTSGVTQIVQGEGINQYSYKTRIPLGVWPCPTLPQFNASLGWRRLVSAASLLRVLIKGK
jgi:hypothetical protein